MRYRSEKQRKYLHAKKPEVAVRFDREEGKKRVRSPRHAALRKMAGY